MKIIAFVHYIYQHFCKTNSSEHAEYVVMDIAMQRIEDNPQVMLFRTDYLE